MERHEMMNDMIIGMQFWKRVKKNFFFVKADYIQPIQYANFI